MAYHLKIKCHGCSAHCPTIPIPYEVVCVWLSSNDETTRQMVNDIVEQKTVFVACQAECQAVYVRY